MTSTHTPRTRLRLLGAGAMFAALALGAAACGSSAASPAASTATPAAATGAAGANAAASSDTAVAFMTASTQASFDDTLSAAKQAVASSGMMVLGTLNQAGALSSTGLSLKGAQSLLVGNPTSGKMFFQQNPAAGAALPLRLYVWADATGSHFGYFDPAAELDAIDPALGANAGKLSMAAAQIAQKATGTAPVKKADATVGFDTVDSGKSFNDTVSALKTSIASGGMMTLGDLDQAKALSMTGLSLQGAHAYFVGNPTTGKMFFQQNPAAGAVLPVEMYVWADAKGSHIGYFDPAAELSAIDSMFASGDSKIAMMVSQIAHGAA